MIAFAEGEVTKLRREFKLVLAPREADALCARLGAELGGVRPAPTRITSVYFDKPGLPLTRRAQHSPQDCLKVRTKEYAPDLGASGQPRVVLEVKRERGGLTQKRREWVPRAELRRALVGGSGVLGLITGGTLSPMLAVTYERSVYQVSQGWRVTVDRDIAYHPVCAELALGERLLCAERLPAPIHRDTRVVVEVKHLGRSTLPTWLAALQAHGEPPYSKFAEGMSRLATAAVTGMAGG